MDKEELEKYWLNVVLPTVDPSIVAPIGFEFQIDETNWANFTSNGIFYAFNTLIL